jgi:hypothetical protein
VEVSSKVFFRCLNRLKAHLPGINSRKKIAGNELLRSELFSAKQLQQHGKAIAGAHKLSPGRTSNQLLTRMADNENVLFDVRNLLTTAVKDNHRV